MKKIFPNILIILGIIIVLIPFIGALYTNYHQKIMISQFEISDNQLDMSSDLLNINNKIFKEINSNDGTLINRISVIGIINIPKIKLNLPIIEGTSENELSQAIGHLDGTSMPGEIGNSVLAGHRSHTFSRFFNRLDELELGDYIYIKTKDGLQKYEVYEKKIVKPTDLSVLKPLKEETTITLITCHPLYSSKKRLILKGRYIASKYKFIIGDF